MTFFLFLFWPRELKISSHYGDNRFLIIELCWIFGERRSRSTDAQPPPYCHWLYSYIIWSKTRKLKNRPPAISLVTHIIYILYYIRECTVYIYIYVCWKVHGSFIFRDRVESEITFGVRVLARSAKLSQPSFATAFTRSVGLDDHNRK